MRKRKIRTPSETPTFKVGEEARYEGKKVIIQEIWSDDVVPKPEWWCSVRHKKGRGVGVRLFGTPMNKLKDV